MTFGIWILVVTTLLYISAGVAFACFEGKAGLGLAYLGYAIGNVGLMMEAMR